MAAAASYNQHQHRSGAGRSKPSPLHTNNSKDSSSSLAGLNTAAKRQQQALTSLAAQLNDEDRAGAHSSTSALRSYQPSNASRAQLRTLDIGMTSHSSTTTLPSLPRTVSGHSKLHKRASSGSSLPGPPSPFSGAHSQFPTPFATYEESFPDMSSATPAVTSTPKIKPYLRKTSAAKDDQGKLDLSRSATENDRIAGLGIRDFGTRSVSDVTFPPAGRRGTHARTTSVGSQVSTASGSFRPVQPFVHPMRQTPRPYTPPTGSSNASFVNEDEANESDDVLEDDFRLGHGFRSKRSMSISSTPAIAPTPLSQTYTADELGLVPKLTSISQTNLSIKSGRSAKSSKSRHGRPRRDTSHSFDLQTSPSSRTSFDKAFSFVSRKSDTDPQTRDERIRAARQKFEEKESSKERRLQYEKLKRRETDEAKTVRRQDKQGRKSEASEQRTRVLKQNQAGGGGGGGRGSPKKRNDAQADNEKLRSKSYDEYRPANGMSLPRQGLQAGASEKTSRVNERKARGAQSGWVRFSAWLQTRILNCGGVR
ncbi:hypothetical protein LTR36_004731 [Oleoguttula mirabilis]|uniref:Uncharacterized protein n=1 Tax=Oleoguttula mirabilis TaxID=1507867 RepID=A0AAV9JG36_9PEZI|nr:hypothetical protein LTR36_004731 [Oleoguttula mirabilis]